MQSGTIKVYLNGKKVTEYMDAAWTEGAYHCHTINPTAVTGPLYVVSSGRNVMKLTEVKAINL